MATIIIFDIENKPADYARAFQFVDTHVCDDKNWQEKHVSLLDAQKEFPEVNISKKTENQFKNIISLVEKSQSRNNTKNPNHMDMQESERYFYFRVKLTADDDVTNLHYYLLARTHLVDENCFLSLRKDTISDSDVFRVSHFLAYEYFRDPLSNPSVKIEASEKNGASARRPYRLRLIPDRGWRDNVFFLRKNTNSGNYYPCNLNKVQLNASHTFFSPAFLNELNYYHLGLSVDVVFGKDFLRNNRESQYIYSDLLSAMLSETENLSGLDKIAIQRLASSNKQFQLISSKFMIVSLKEYCKTCYKLIDDYSRKESLNDADRNLLKNIKEFCENRTSDFSVLSYCIFVSFISFLINSRSGKADEPKLDIDSLMMDTEDYADGLLQIIENAASYAGGGFFCFRIHNRKKNCDKVNELCKKYRLMADQDFYMEFLVSDMNKTKDIPRQFFENIEKRRNEYIINDDLMNDMKRNFTLNHFFDYDMDKNGLWTKFYSNDKNITSHYGLLVFESLVKFAKGGFRVISQSDYLATRNHIYSSTNEEEPSIWHLPGTQYEIMLPIMFSHKPFATGLNTQLDIKTISTNYEQKNIESETMDLLRADEFGRDLLEFFTSDVKPVITNYRRKMQESIVNDIINNKVNDKVNDKERLEPKSGKDTTIVCFDVLGINHTIAAEIFVKSFISSLYIFNKKIKYFAILNASDTMLATFIRIFSLLYMKSEQASIMENSQVFICSKEAQKEYLFYGESIQKSVIASNSLASVKGMYEREFSMLSRIAEKCKKKRPRKPLELFPFDILLNHLFESKVKADLNRSLQQLSFGCCLKEVHMRVGSKIHIYGNYYEASLLFGLSNYVSRFAYIVAKKSIGIIEKTEVARIVLVGYEAYSESMLVSTQNTMKHYFSEHGGPKVDYVIYYEGNRAELFARWSDVKPDMDTKFIIVVPIGSTLTTHDKVVADLCRQNFDKTNQAINIDSILVHYTLTLIRNVKQDGEDQVTGCRKIESDFWSKIEVALNDKHVIYKKANIGADNRIELFAVTESKWLLPNECDYCYPDYTESVTGLANEKPMIQTNRASVVPMTMIGLRDFPEESKYSRTYDMDYEDNLPLLAGLCYGHVDRGRDNHYMYYFQTDKIMDAIMDDEQQRNRFKEWLNKTHSAINLNPNNTLVYHFIVAPLHKTNARFIQEVNKEVFLNAQQVIWLDVKREYRDNVKTKYSNITSLFENLKELGKEADIHLHFVDDTITSGFSINRAKSLLSSLFIGKSDNIHLYSSVILLINRCSDSTMKSYVQKDSCHSFIKLNISVMRSHNDACVPCKNYENYMKKMSSGASTNILANKVLSKARKFELRAAENIITPEHMLPLYDQDNNRNYCTEALRIRYYNRLISNHRFNSILGKMGGNQNDYEKAEEKIWEELSTICASYVPGKPDTFECVYERLYSSLKVVTRPFLSFRQSVLHAATSIVLKIAIYFLWELGDIDKEIRIFINAVKTSKNKKRHEVYIKLLFSCLANVNSTFLVRAVTINSFFDYCKKNELNSDELKIHYILCAKHLLYLSGKENLSVWLESLLSNKCEPFPKINENRERINMENEGVTEFVRIMRLENTRPIREVLEECFLAVEREKGDIKSSGGMSEEDEEKLVDNTLNQYYCKTYVDFINECGFGAVTQTFLPMHRLYVHLTASGNNAGNENMQQREEAYYGKFLEYVTKILDTNDVLLSIEQEIVQDEQKKKKTVTGLYPKKTRSQYKPSDTYLRRFTSRISETGDEYDKGKQIWNTLYWGKEGNECIGLLKFVKDWNRQRSNGTPCWYLAFVIKDELNDEKSIESLIVKARNVLAMRHEILKKLTEDFDNNLISTYISTQNQLIDLSTEKSGSHTPFEELRDAFFDVFNPYDPGKGNEKEKDAERKNLVGNQLKLISDSLISKLFVLSILKETPKDICVQGKDFYDNEKALLRWWDIVNNNANLASKVKNSTRKPVIKCSESFSWGDLEIQFPEKCEFIWYSAFIAIIINALRHGRGKLNDSKCYDCDILIDYIKEGERGYITFENYCKEQNDTQEYSPKEMVTLKALQFYFDNYYGKGEFVAEDVSINGEKGYRVKLPCKRNLERI